MAKAKKKSVKKSKAKKVAPKKNGRPFVFDKSMIKQAEYAASKGFTDAELGKLFGVSRASISNWKIRYPLFAKSLEKGKAVADEQVERALFERATGYSHPDVHISNGKNGVTVTQIIKHYPPDATSCIFWLKNRKPAEWRDKHEIEADIKINYIDLLERKGNE